MEIMKLPFVLMTLTGCWRPPSWSTSSRRIIYNVYTLLILCLMYFTLVGQFVILLQNVDNVDDFSDSFCLLLGLLTANLKMLMLLWNRRNISILADNFKEGSFLPLNDIEWYMTNFRTNTLYYFILGDLTVWTMVASALFSNFPRRKLMYRVWLPYDCYSSTLLFILNYIHQCIALAYTSTHHVACDSLITGFLIHMSCQLELLGCRLKGLEHATKRSIKACIKHHQRIYRFADQLNTTFRMTLLIQFTASMFVMCMNMYQLVKSKGVNGMFLQLMFYSMSGLAQMFVYCWYGNESRDVSNAVFEMNWTNFDADSRKTILTIMQRTELPIELSGFYIVTMDLDTFVNILKASYSAYNMMQQA